MSNGRETPRTLPALRLPVIAINPDAPPTDVASMERAGVKVVIMPCVGHFLPLEDSVRFNRLLRDAIRSLAP